MSATDEWLMEYHQDGEWPTKQEATIEGCALRERKRILQYSHCRHMAQRVTLDYMLAVDPTRHGGEQSPPLSKATGYCSRRHSATRAVINQDQGESARLTFSSNAVDTVDDIEAEESRPCDRSYVQTETVEDRMHACMQRSMRLD